MPNIRVILEYDGTRYHGWQIQPDVPTVESELREACFKLFGQRVQTIGAARTDRGVHARGQVVNFDSPRHWPERQYVAALNTFLPGDIVVRDARKVAVGFHARHDACGKEYRYHIWNNPFAEPWFRPFCWQVGAKLDLDCLREAAQHLIGEHDFSAFENTGSPCSSSIKRVESIQVYMKQPILVFSIRANAFLYRMVRNIVGTLSEVGRGVIPVGEVASILASRDRRRAGPTAPAHGLFLWRVLYPPAME